MEQESILYQPENPYTDRGNLIDKGNDFNVYEFGDEYVVKLPNEEHQEERPYNNMSPEFYERLVDDYSVLKGIFGENLAETYFFPPSKEWESNYRIIQKRYKSEEFLSNLSGQELIQFIKEHKEEFRDIVNKVKQAQEHFGVPVDLTPRNLVFHEGKLIIIETDCPTERFNHRSDYERKIEREMNRIALVEELVKQIDSLLMVGERGLGHLS